MKKNKFKLMFTPNFNEIVILKRNIFLFILDVLIITSLFYFNKTEYIFNFLVVRFLFITIEYLLKIIKYSLALLRHRLDIALITSNKYLQDDLFEKYNLKDDINKNTNKELFMCLEYFFLCMVIYLCSKCYFNSLLKFNLASSIIVHMLFVILVFLILFRIEKNFKKAEERHNILMFLAINDKI